MQMAEKSRALTLLQKGHSVIAVARDIGVLREAIYQLKRSATLLPPRMIMKRKLGSGAPKKTSPKTDKILKRERTSYSSTTTVEFKKTSTQCFYRMSPPGQFVMYPKRS